MLLNPIACETEQIPALPYSSAPSPIATVINITKRYGTTLASTTSISLYPGEVVALLGPYGAGKSTAVKLSRRSHRPRQTLALKNLLARATNLQKYSTSRSCIPPLRNRRLR
jgi:ABC-type hemin transport system ATPase subunit